MRLEIGEQAIHALEPIGYLPAVDVDVVALACHLSNRTGTLSTMFPVAHERSVFFSIGFFLGVLGVALAPWR